MPHTGGCCVLDTVKNHHIFKKKLLKRLYIINKNKKKKLNATLIDIKVEIHGIAYDLTHLDNLK